MITGLVLLLAVAVDSLSRRRQPRPGEYDRPMARRARHRGEPRRGRRGRPRVPGLGAQVGLLSRSGRRPRARRRAGRRRATCATASAVFDATRQVVERFGAPGLRGRERRHRRLRPVPRARPRARRGDDRRQPQGHAVHRARDAAAPDRGGRGRLRVARLGRRPARLPGRDRLQRVEVRAGRLHPLARPRDARARRALHERRARAAIATDFAIGTGRTARRRSRG